MITLPSSPPKSPTRHLDDYAGEILALPLSLPTLLSVSPVQEHRYGVIEPHFARNILNRIGWRCQRRRTRQPLKICTLTLLPAADGSGMPIVFEVFCIYIHSGLWTNEFAFWLANQAGIPVVSCSSDSYFVTIWRLIKLLQTARYKRLLLIARHRRIG